MLQKMGEHIHGWIAGIIVVVISVVFALWGVSYYISSTRPDQEVIAKVNGTKLIGKQLSDMFQSAITADPKLSMASPEKKLAKKKLLVKQWVNQQAVMTTLHKSGMVVSPELVKQFVLSIPAFQQNGQFSNLAFQSYLIQNHMNEMQFYQKVSKQIATMQFLSAIEKSTFVLPNEINHYFQLLSQQRTFKYALLSAKNYIYQVKVKAGDLKTYYQNHLDQFLVPEKVSVNYIELTPKSVANSIMITNDQIKSYYQDHIKTFTKPASWTYVTYSIASLRSHFIKENNKQIEARFNAQVAKLKNGQGINDFLKANKADTKTSAQLAPAMVNILKGLKPGQVSKIDNSNILRGKTVFYLVSDTPKHVSSLAKVKQEVKALLTKQQISQLLSSKSDQMTNLAYSNPEGLTEVAKTMGLPLQVSKPFSRQGTKTGITSMPKFVSTAFGDIVLAQGMNSDPVNLKNGSVVIMHLQKHYAAYHMPFDKVVDKVKTLFIQSQANKMINQKANRLAADMNAGKDVTLPWKFEKSITIHNKDLAKNILDAIFDQPFNVGHNPVAFVVPVNDQQVALVQLLKLHLFPIAKMSNTQKSYIQKTLLSNQQKALMILLMKSFYNHSKIKVYYNRIQ